MFIIKKGVSMSSCSFPIVNDGNASLFNLDYLFSITEDCLQSRTEEFGQMYFSDLTNGPGLSEGDERYSMGEFPYSFMPIINRVSLEDSPATTVSTDSPSDIEHFPILTEAKDNKASLFPISISSSENEDEVLPAEPSDDESTNVEVAAIIQENQKRQPAGKESRLRPRSTLSRSSDLGARLLSSSAVESKKAALEDMSRKRKAESDLPREAIKMARKEPKGKGPMLRPRSALSRSSNTHFEHTRAR